MAPENEIKKLNPRITDVIVGIRDLRTIRIYPLSVADQTETTNIITDALQEFFSQKLDDTETVGFVIKLIKENLARVITLATCDEVKGEDLLKDLDNFQATEIAKVIYEVNYEAPGKNVKSLFEKVKSLFQSERPLPQSVDTTPTMGLDTLQTIPIKKAE
jgi:hypothetical protein